MEKFYATIVIISKASVEIMCNHLRFQFVIISCLILKGVLYAYITYRFISILDT
jgi:hypothetical protein